MKTILVFVIFSVPDYYMNQCWFIIHHISEDNIWRIFSKHSAISVHEILFNLCRYSSTTRKHVRSSVVTEALKGHRVVWKIEIYYLIRMTYEWKSMSSGWHNNIVVTHPDEIPISAKSSGWHMVVWYVIRMTYCSVQKSSGWDTARS